MNREDLIRELKNLKDLAYEWEQNQEISESRRFECWLAYKMIEAVLNELDENDEIWDEKLEWLCRNYQWIKCLY